MRLGKNFFILEVTLEITPERFTEQPPSMRCLLEEQL
jgi:hypothetical protein